MAKSASKRDRGGTPVTVAISAWEIFSCAGGMAEGFRRSGIEFTASVDADGDACDSYASNLGRRPIQMDVRDLLRLARLGALRPALDLLVADPPCTPWSRAGKRDGLDDERDMLQETVSLLDLLRPRTWLIGNVPGLVDAGNWRDVVVPVIGAWAAGAGYCVDYAKMDAADYGVPQHRVRPFWFGHPRGTPCLRWPAATHGDWSTMRMDGRRPWLTCADALQGLSEAELGSRVRLRRRSCNGKQHGSVAERPAHVVGTSTLSDGNVLLVNEKHLPSRDDRPSKTIAASMRGNGGSFLERRRDNGSSREHSPDEPARTIRASRSSSERLLVTRKHPVSASDAPARTITASDGGGAKGSRVMAWPWDRPATCVQADERLGSPGHKDENWLVADGNRVRGSASAIRLSEKAATVLQGFPESWVFAGQTKRSRWSQIGQAMPPPLAAAVARSITEWFSGEDARTERAPQTAGGRR